VILVPLAVLVFVALMFSLLNKVEPPVEVEEVDDGYILNNFKVDPGKDKG